MIHNIVSFYGADHKVGTTMVAQSVAEIISSNDPNLKVLFIAMNGRESNEYIRETPGSIDDYKYLMDNKMINGSDFLKTSIHKGNFYMMAGVCNEMEIRYYYPEMARYLLEEISSEFDLIIADCGSELDNGLSIGTLEVSEEIILVASQQETVIKRYEKNKNAMDGLGIGISNFVINKFSEQDPYGLSYLSNRMGIDKEKFWKVSMADYSRQAEMDGKTLLEYKNEIYLLDIISIANNLLSRSGFPEIQKQRKSRWRSFI